MAILGSSDTYGRFIDRPFPALIESALELPCINLGCANAGVDAFLNDDDLMEISAGAEVTVVQVMGAQNLTNRYYRVHPRRNDRFLAATPMLSAIYPEVDFTDFHFNKHMLITLHALSAERFAAVRRELQSIWVARMRLLLRKTGQKTLLLWLRYRNAKGPLGADPWMVTREMLAQLEPDVGGILEVPVTLAGPAGETPDMHFGPLQAPAAEQAIGPVTHSEIARQLGQALSRAM